MIVLMGVVLAISIFVISSLASDIINLDIVVSNERASSLVTEFSYIKKTFGVSLNYNLSEDIEKADNRLIFQGDIHKSITDAFSQTRDEFYVLELQYGNIFNATLNSYWPQYLQNETEKDSWYVHVTISLEDGNTYITEDVLYSIILNPET